MRRQCSRALDYAWASKAGQFERRRSTRSDRLQFASDGITERHGGGYQCAPAAARLFEGTWWSKDRPLDGSGFALPSPRTP